MQIRLRYFHESAKCILMLLVMASSFSLCAQDSTRKKHSLKEFATDVYHSFFITRKKTDDSVFFQRSEKSFQQYAGKAVRKIIVRKLAFGQNILDTSERIIGAISRFANKLQTGTKPFIIEQFVFVKEGETLDPYRLADNERLFRQLDFIKDSRIRVVSLRDNPDSVDVYVIVRDVFSIGGKADASGINELSATVYDANLFGRAQRINYTLLLDKNRKPKFGSDILFRKYNISKLNQFQSGFSQVQHFHSYYS